jgi:branched-chain amino acid transport system substrate-binding protein
VGRSRLRALGAGLLGLSLVAAACGGGDDGGGSATGATVDPGVKQGIDQALNGGGGGNGSSGGSAATTTSGAPGAAPTTMEQWEALWKTEREAIVKRITDNGWGKSADGKTLTGPEGFTIDLSKCPAGWSDTEGLTDTSIKIGQTASLSGTTADYGYIPKAIQVMFDHYGDQGAFTDSLGKNRKVTYIVKDDGYDPARTIPLVDELIDSEKVFDQWVLGSPNNLKVYDKLNQRCIPSIMIMSGHPAFGDPVNHPWSAGMQMAYNTEAVLWGGFIEQHLEEFQTDKVKVAALLMNNEFGLSYDSAFKAYLAQSEHKDRIEYFTERIEVQAPTIKDAMTTIASKKPNVFIVMSTGVPCTQSIIESAENGMKEEVPYKFMSSVCKGSGFVGKDKVGGDGSATDGWWVVGGGAKDLQSSAYDTDPFIVWARDLLTQKGINYKESGSLGSGIYFGWSFAQVLQIAGALPGGLTRTNFILADRTLDMTHPFLLPGVNFNMNGNKDAYLVEGSEFGKYDYTKQNWVPQGDVIDLSGKSNNCAWDQSASACR